MESSTILSILFGSSSTQTATTTTTTESTLKIKTEQNYIINNINDNENTVTSQLIISPSSSSSLFNIFNSNNNNNNNEMDDIIATTTEYTTNGLSDIVQNVVAENSIHHSNNILNNDATIETVATTSGTSAAAAAMDLWNDQQITFEIPSSNDLEKINNLDNFTNLFHRIINNAQQQQQQQHTNLIDNNDNNRLFNTHFDTNGSPVINLADLKTNYDNSDLNGGGGGGSGGLSSFADDLFNLNNFNQQNHNNINLLNDNNDNINNLENILFGNVNMQNLINYLWIGVVTSLIILSVIFIIFSCYFYRKFKEWKKCNKDIRSQMTSTEFYHAQYGPNNNGITACNGGVGGTNETGYYQMESPPCYTIATGLPSYDEALLYFSNNHQHHSNHPHHHHHHLLLHHNQHHYQKSLQSYENHQYEQKQKEFSYIYINDTPTSQISENSIRTILSTNHHNYHHQSNDNNRNCNSLIVNGEQQLSQQLNLNQNITVLNNDTVIDCSDNNSIDIKVYYPSEYSSGQQQQQQQQQISINEIRTINEQNQQNHKHQYDNSNNIDDKKSMCLKHLQQQQQSNKHEQDFQMTESLNFQHNNSPAIIASAFIPNHNHSQNTDNTIIKSKKLLIKETNFQHENSIEDTTSLSSSPSLAAAESIEEIENCNNSNLNVEAIGTQFTITTHNNDQVVISCPFPSLPSSSSSSLELKSSTSLPSLINDNNYNDKISSNLVIKENSINNLNGNSHNNNNSNNSSNSNDSNLREGNCTDITVMP